MSAPGLIKTFFLIIQSYFYHTLKLLACVADRQNGRPAATQAIELFDAFNFAHASLQDKTVDVKRAYG